MDYASGIDVSHWQGVINWDAIASVGAVGTVQFAYIKATDGEHGLDPQFAQNWGRAQAAKLPRGAYHFFRAGLDVGSQIRATIAALGAPGDDGELPPALDVEVGPMDRAEFEDVLQWLEGIEAFYKRTPLLYLNRSGIAALNRAYGLYVATSAEQVAAAEAAVARFSHFPLWLAEYSGGDKPPRLDGPWDSWALWQHTPQGKVAGLSAAVDLDYCWDLHSLFSARPQTTT